MNEDERGKRPFRSRLGRDTILFCGGLAGVLHETLWEKAERPSLLIVFAGMMGLPLYLRRNGM